MKKDALLNLDNLTLLDISGVERSSLNIRVNKSQLSDLFVEKWIPYFECHKCGKFDYCKFAKPHPANPNRSIDIKCGVAENILRNFVRSTFPLLKGYSREQLQAYLNGAYYLSQYVLDTEIDNGRMMKWELLNHWKSDSPRMFSAIIGQRKNLNLMAENFRLLPKLHWGKGVIFVEGPVELVFLETLKESQLLWFLNLEIEVYGGEGNAKPHRIEMLLSDYKKRGYEIYIEGDGDGDSSKKKFLFQKFIEKGIFKKKNGFIFKYDFETSIPMALMFYSLQDIGEIKSVKEKDFFGRWLKKKGPVSDFLIKEYKLDLNGVKKYDLAIAVAKNLNSMRATWWGNESFMKTELGRFLHYVQKIN